MNIDKKVENIFGNMSNLDILNSYNCHTLLDISEPLMFVLNELDKYYLAYTLQNRTAFLNNGARADVIELLIVSTSVSKIKMLLEGQMDIKDALSSEVMYRMGKIGNKIFPKKYVYSVDQVENKIPKLGVRFDCSLPNKINIKKTLSLIEADARFYDSFAINDTNILKKDHIHIKLENTSDFRSVLDKVDFKIKDWTLE
ncbi:hypothetical protein AAF454_13725 [Kurthia gibsonii]|uniref:Uncharacterized protein n=1 Tax=Kurthia gibsonii TaxID=33946 RepID=A0ABU9LQL2_9BACL|nr:hypothetical protein [Kurthia sp. 11kri321]AMA64522.1 hypothetical protein ASO14_369 [Kurthia sp. 11kri321]